MKVLRYLAPLPLLLVSSCDGDPPPEYEDGLEFVANVDCLAMNYAHAHEGLTPVPLAGELTPSEADLNIPEDARLSRCYYRFTGGAMQEGKQQIPWTIDGEGYLNGSVFTINYQGIPWTYTEGEFVIDEIAGNESWPNAKGRGHYDAIFKVGGVNSASGRAARFKGNFDWCDPLRANDCPYNAYHELQPQWSLDTPWTNTQGSAAECRMIVDHSTGGLQVDMQIGSVLGADVTQIYALWCGWIGSIINKNRFTFRSGGVTGVGAYGPYVVTEFGDNQNSNKLPDLEWDLPLTLSYIFENETQGCALSPSNPATLLTYPDAQCSFIIEEDHFTLDCDDAEYFSGFFATPKPSGSLHFESDCQLIELNN